MSLSSCRHSWIDITGRLVPVMAASFFTGCKYSILKKPGCIGSADEMRLRGELRLAEIEQGSPSNPQSLDSADTDWVHPSDLR